jgi:acetyl-CoA carboxylase biotin carboxyl carrier protein
MSEDSQKDDIFSLESVRELLRLIGQSDVTELLIERDGAKLRLKRSTTVESHQHGHIAPVLSAAHLAPLGSTATGHHPGIEASGAEEEEEVPGGHMVLAPMVGTFYSAPSPRDPAFVKEGDEVGAGDTVGIIEAMKIMNEIECEVDGRIARILVQNGQPVEYGQPIMVVEPLEA